MAAKVALTAEEFRENSQRSIALFNTEKLSTDSTHVLKSAYCNSVHFCRCNLHGACGGKARDPQSAVQPVRCNLHGACGGKAIAPTHAMHQRIRCNLHGACGGKACLVCDSACADTVAICTGRVEAKLDVVSHIERNRRCNLHGACGGKGIEQALNRVLFSLQSARGVWRQRTCLAHLDCIFWLQSARGVWRQRCTSISSVLLINRCNLHGACGGKVVLLGAYNTFYTLQSARGVWKTLHHPPEKNPRKFMQTYCIFIHLGV